MLNEQPILKADHKRDGVSHPLEITEIFYTIQGEGPYSGMPAIFIRFAGCNLRCFWCDTAYDKREELMIYEIANRVEVAYGDSPRPQLIVMTGGEPMRQNIMPLIRALGPRYAIQIETNGTLLPPDWDFLWSTIVCSPKTGEIHKKIINAPHVHWKYIISADNIKKADDGLPMLSTQREHTSRALFRPEKKKGAVPLSIYVSPLDAHEEEDTRANYKATAEVALKHGYRISLQTHKILELP